MLNVKNGESHPSEIQTCGECVGIFSQLARAAAQERYGKCIPSASLSELNELSLAVLFRHL